MKTKTTLLDFALNTISEKTQTDQIFTSFKSFKSFKKIRFLLVFFVLNLNAQIPWIKQTPVFPAGYTSVSSFSFIDSNNLWVYSNNEPLKKIGFSKTANGTNWINSGELNYGAAFTFIEFQAISANTAFILFADNPDWTSGTIKKTTDGGRTWVNKWQFSSFPNFIHFFDSNTGIVVCDPNQPNGNFLIYQTINGGESWELVSPAITPIENEFGLTGSYAYNEDSLWFTTSTGRFFKTYNRGTTWTYEQSPFTVSYANNSTNLGSHFFIENSEIAYVLNGNASTLRFTIDGGVFWYNYEGPKTGNQSYIKKISNENILIAAGVLSTKYSKDGGQTWILMDNKGKTYMNSINANSTWAIGIDNGLVVTDYALYKLDPAVLKVFDDKNQTQKINIQSILQK